MLPQYMALCDCLYVRYVTLSFGMLTVLINVSGFMVLWLVEDNL